MKRFCSSVLVMLLCAALLTGCGGTKAGWQEQYDLGVRYLSDGNYEEAILAFSAAISIDPKKLEAYACRAEAYAATGNYTAAQTDYETVIDVFPDFYPDPSQFPYLTELVPYIHSGQLPPRQTVPQPVEDADISLTGNYWQLICGPALGSSYDLSFNADGTYDAIGIGSGMVGSGTYRYENGVLTLDNGGIASMYTATAAFTWGEDGFISIDGYDTMDMDAFHYTIAPISRQMWIDAHSYSNPWELMHFWRVITDAPDSGELVWDIQLAENGRAALGLGFYRGEYASYYEGQWYLRRMEGDMYVVDLIVAGGEYDVIGGEDATLNASDYTVTVGIWLENDQMYLQKISGDDIHICYDQWYFQENLSFLE